MINSFKKGHKISYKKLKLVLFIFSAISVSLGCYSCSQDSERINTKEQSETKLGEKTYNFLEKLEHAEIRTKKESYTKVSKTFFTINSEMREVLFEHPVTEVIFTNVPIHENSLLVFGIGMHQPSWIEPGDGVFYAIFIDNEKIFSKYIDPKKYVEHRRWFDEQIDLSVFAGQKVSFVFKTTGGPKGDVGCDWAGWSNPRIIYPKR